jgi:hypothetical protein
MQEAYRIGKHLIEGVLETAMGVHEAEAALLSNDHL